MAAALAVVVLPVAAVANHPGGTTHVMTVIISGSGSVASSPAGIACPPDCTETYTNATMVNLTATPDAGASFTSWQGSVCTGQSPANPCVGIPMIDTRMITATFSGGGGGGHVMVGTGDLCGSNCNATANLADGLNADSHFTLGDNAYNDGTTAEYNSGYCSGSPCTKWGRPAINNSMYPAMGNHDCYTSGCAGAVGFFGSDASLPPGATSDVTDMTGSVPPFTYSYTKNGWLIVVLNSGGSNGSGKATTAQVTAQNTALNTLLTNSSATCEVVMWHHPRRTSGDHSPGDSFVQQWITSAYAKSVDIVLNGHSHSYERFQEVNASYVPAADGFRQFIVGTGGASLDSARSSTAPGSQVWLNGFYGVLKLTLNTGGYDWAFHGTTGTPAIKDSGSDTCHNN